MKIKFLLLGLLLVCNWQLFAQSYGAPYASVECLNVELDGSITVRVTGFGRNRLDAKEQARKNAVYNDGKTAAKYQSSDKGSTWKYIGQVEIKD